MDRKVDLVALSRQAVQAIHLADQTVCDIRAATDFMKRANEGCQHSRGLALAFIQSAGRGVGEFADLLSTIAAKRRMIDPESNGDMARQSKEGVLMIVATAFARESDLLQRFEQLRNETERFGGSNAR